MPGYRLKGKFLIRLQQIHSDVGDAIRELESLTDASPSDKDLRKDLHIIMMALEKVIP